MLCYVIPGPTTRVGREWRRRVRRGTIVRTTQAERGRVERRQRAASEIQNLLADLYRGFVGEKGNGATPGPKKPRPRRVRGHLRSPRKTPAPGPGGTQAGPRRFPW